MSENAGFDGGSLVFNLNDVDENKKFDIMPKGEYPAIVDEMDFGPSKAGNPMITTKYNITEGEYEGRVVYDYWVLQGDGSEFGLAKLKKFMTRICPEIPLDGFNPQTFCDEGIAIGRECRIKLKIQTQKKGEYKGEKRNTIQEVLAPEENSFL